MYGQTWEYWWEVFVGGRDGRVEFHHLHGLAMELYREPHHCSEESQEKLFEVLGNNPSDIIILRAWLQSMGQFPTTLSGSVVTHTKGDNEQTRLRFRQSIAAIKRMAIWDNAPLLTGLALHYTKDYRPVAMKRLSKLAITVEGKIINRELGLGSSVLVLQNTNIQKELELPDPDCFFEESEARSLWRALNGKTIGL